MAKLSELQKNTAESLGSQGIQGTEGIRGTQGTNGTQGTLGNNGRILKMIFNDYP
jgi:hypothetical protein